MSGFIVGADRNQSTLFPERPDDFVAEESATRVIDVFVDEIDLSGLGFKTEPADTGRPGYHPEMMLKLFIYGYMNRIQSSHRLEQEAQRNVELMWLTGRLPPFTQIWLDNSLFLSALSRFLPAGSLTLDRQLPSVKWASNRSERCGQDRRKSAKSGTLERQDWLNHSDYLFSIFEPYPYA